MCDLWFKDNSLIILLLAGTLFNVLWLLKMQNRLRIRWPSALLISVLHTLVGVLFVKVFASLEGGDVGNMSLFGAVFFMPIVYWIGAKITRCEPKDVFDVLVVCTIFTLMCARVNCIISGCCSGSAIPGLSLHWPTRELEIAFYLVLIPLLIKRIRQKKIPGSAYPIYMISYGIFRFITEFFRAADSGTIFHIAHIWSLISLGMGLSIYLELKSKKGKERK